MKKPTDYSAFPFHLKSCVWELTLACCFNCVYCGSKGGKARENELSTSECLNIARQLYELGCKRVSLIGGEVFMRDDWDIIARAFTSLGIKVCIITNGYRITPEIISSLKKAEIESIAVSVDGPAEAHDAFRQKGSFERAFKTIKALTYAGIHVSVISSLRADNVSKLDEFYEILKHYNIFAWQLQACSPMGSARDNRVDFSFDSKEVIRFIRNVGNSSPFIIGAADNIGYYTPDEPFMRGRSGAVFAGCSAGLTTIGIDSVGNVRGCESMYDDRFIEGNLRERTLLDIWTDPNAFSYNRSFDKEMLTGACKSCEHSDICAGGCRSYNFFSTGRLYESPLCAKNN